MVPAFGLFFNIHAGQIDPCRFVIAISSPFQAIV
jgi:hypothetical protein